MLNHLHVKTNQNKSALDYIQQKRLGNSEYILPEVQKQIKKLNLNLDRVLQQGGLCKQIQISQILNDKTTIEIIEPGVFIYCNIPLQGVSLPVKIKIFHKQDHDHKDLTTFRDLPEDMNVFLSMNEVEPGPRRHDKKVDSTSI